MQHLFFVVFLASRLAFATPQPQKESNLDLRAGLEVFAIEDLEGESVYWLERTANLDYFLRMKQENGKEKIQKIPTPEAKKLDREFASHFLKIQYELPPSPEGCKVTLRLTMKGETQNICRKEEGKTQEIQPFFKDLSKRF